MLIPAGDLVVDHVCRSPGQVRHDVLDVEREQFPGRYLVVHEHAGGAQELHGLKAGRCRERQVAVLA